MKARIKDFPLTIDEVRALIKEEQSKKGIWIGVGVGVLVVLIGVIIWIAAITQKDKDLEEHYEYFDGGFDNADEDYDSFDESIYDDLEEDEDAVEYVKIHNFMDEEDHFEADEVEEAGSAKDDK